MIKPQCSMSVAEISNMLRGKSSLGEMMLSIEGWAGWQALSQAEPPCTMTGESPCSRKGPVTGSACTEQEAVEGESQV